MDNIETLDTDAIDLHLNENNILLFRDFIGKNALNIYVAGSRAYNCHKENSDFDFIIVTKNLSLKDTIIDGSVNLTVYSIEDFKKKIVDHDISVLECLWLPNNKVLKEEIIFDYNLTLYKLRSSLSEKASLSWVKAKKKFAEEPYIAKKSLFHALRILIFGIQIAKEGSIIDFTAANKLHKEIMTNSAVGWRAYKQKYKRLYNDLKSQFRAAAPKLLKEGNK